MGSSAMAVEWIGFQREADICEAGEFTSAAKFASSVTLLKLAVEGLLSSLGYLWAGTSLRNVAPSHAIRMIDEPLTKCLVFIE